MCHEAMEAGTEVLEMPCKHCYHEGCITSWLSEVSWGWSLTFQHS